MHMDEFMYVCLKVFNYKSFHDGQFNSAKIVIFCQYRKKHMEHK